MDTSEKIFFALLDCIFCILFFFLAAASFVSPVYSMLMGVVTGHTLHWLFDGHFYVLLKKLGYAHTEASQFDDYIAKLTQRAKREPSVAAVAAFGSLSRGQLTPKSDLDVRVIRHPGVVNGLKACFFTFLERSRALLVSLPLDIYTLDNIRGLKKLRSDEPPVILYDPQKLLHEFAES